VEQEIIFNVKYKSASANCILKFLRNKLKIRIRIKANLSRRQGKMKGWN